MAQLAKILIVDDSPKYLQDTLPMYGYEVASATDGIQAIKLLSKSEAGEFDLILLDVMMPNLNGWDTLKAIRTNEKFKYTPVIMLTAVNDEQKIVSGLKIGADDYIIKPFILPNLLARIEAILRRSKWQKVKKPMAQDLPFCSDEPIETLTLREREVLTLVAKGANNQAIANKLFVKEVTVKTHLNNIFKKLKVGNRTQAVVLAMQMNLINK